MTDDIGYPKSRQLGKGKKDPTPKVRLTPAVLLQAVLQHYRNMANKAEPTMMAMEVATGNRRMDGLLLRYYHAPIAFEVKLSRADWLSELRKPGKQDEALALAGMVYIVAPPDVVQVDEVPTGMGLLEVKPFTSQVKVAKRATRINAPGFDYHMAATIAAGILRAADQGVV